MSQLTYEAAVYSRTISYKNFKGKTVTVELTFALDPMQLLELFAKGFPTKKVKSGNPARRDEMAPMTDEQQIRFFRDLASKSAGTPSDDGESWEPFEDFENSLAGKAFMTKLAASDSDRVDFAEKVLIKPFEAYIGYAEADPTNSQKEVQDLKQMLDQLRNVLAAPAPAGETIEEKRLRLEKEIAALQDDES